MKYEQTSQTEDTTYFRYCRMLDGALVAVDIARRNGRRVPLFSPSVIHYPQPTETYPATCVRQQDCRYYVNLNDVERRTWRQILAAIPIGTIARNEGVSRQAIYARLLGRRGYGGMIGKNYWVLIWCIARGLHPRSPRRPSSSPDARH